MSSESDRTEPNDLSRETERPRILSARSTHDTTAEQVESPLTDHSIHFCRFVQEIVECKSSKAPQWESNDALTSLRYLTRSPEESNAIRDLSFLPTDHEQPKPESGMPSLKDTVHILRWAKGMVIRSTC